MDEVLSRIVKWYYRPTSGVVGRDYISGTDRASESGAPLEYADRTGDGNNKSNER